MLVNRHLKQNTVIEHTEKQLEKVMSNVKVMLNEETNRNVDIYMFNKPVSSGWISCLFHMPQ